MDKKELRKRYIKFLADNGAFPGSNKDVDITLDFLQSETKTAEVKGRKKSYEAIHAIHMAHDWNETSKDLKDWLEKELHDILRLQESEGEG